MRALSLNPALRARRGGPFYEGLKPKPSIEGQGEDLLMRA
jgi:hypothetical protein